MLQKRKHFWKKILLFLLLVLFLAIAGLAAFRCYMRFSSPKEYMVTSENYFDYQKHYECSGYASAYVLRSLGEEADGLELYSRFTDKNPDGTLAPGYLWENLRDMGYKCSLRIGNMMDIKYNVSQGVPVVVLIRLNMVQPYLHYVPVVGYDEDYVYIADSLDYMVNEKNENYNRKIPIDEFKQLWKTDTFVVNNIYLKLGVSGNK